MNISDDCAPVLQNSPKEKGEINSTTGDCSNSQEESKTLSATDHRIENSEKDKSLTSQESRIENSVSDIPHAVTSIEEGEAEETDGQLHTVNVSTTKSLNSKEEKGNPTNPETETVVNEPIKKDAEEVSDGLLNIGEVSTTSEAKSLNSTEEKGEIQPVVNEPTEKKSEEVTDGQLNIEEVSTTSEIKALNSKEESDSSTSPELLPVVSQPEYKENKEVKQTLLQENGDVHKDQSSFESPAFRSEPMVCSVTKNSKYFGVKFQTEHNKCSVTFGKDLSGMFTVQNKNSKPLGMQNADSERLKKDGDIDLTCVICRCIPRDRGSFLEHLNSKHPIIAKPQLRSEGFLCRQCPFRCKSWKDLLSHRCSNKIIPTYNCLCSFSCGTAENFRLHLKNEHGATKPPFITECGWFTCQNCGFEFEEYAHLAKHELSLHQNCNNIPYSLRKILTKMNESRSMTDTEPSTPASVILEPGNSMFQINSVVGNAKRQYESKSKNQDKKRMRKSAYPSDSEDETTDLIANSESTETSSEADKIIQSPEINKMTPEVKSIKESPKKSPPRQTSERVNFQPKSRYPCYMSQCYLKFKNLAERKHHTATHFLDSTVLCPFCNYSYKKKSSNTYHLDDHIKSNHSKQYLYSLELFRNPGSSPAASKMQVVKGIGMKNVGAEAETPEVPEKKRKGRGKMKIAGVKCPLCPKLIREVAFEMHIKTDHEKDHPPDMEGKRFRCEEKGCNFTTRRWYAFLYHQSQTHSNMQGMEADFSKGNAVDIKDIEKTFPVVKIKEEPTDPPTFITKVVQNKTLVFPSPKVIVQHKFKDKNTFSKYKKRFPDPKIHSNPYVVMKDIFQTQKALRKAFTNSTSKPGNDQHFPEFQCPFCTDSSSNQFKILAHINTKHDPESQKDPHIRDAIAFIKDYKFKCNVCDHSTSNQLTFFRHGKTHACCKKKATLFSCDFCDFLSIKRIAMMKHYKTKHKEEFKAKQAREKKTTTPTTTPQRITPGNKPFTARMPVADANKKQMTILQKKHGITPLQNTFPQPLEIFPRNDEPLIPTSNIIMNPQNQIVIAPTNTEPVPPVNNLMNSLPSDGSSFPHINSAPFPVQLVKVNRPNMNVETPQPFFECSTCGMKFLDRQLYVNHLLAQNCLKPSYM